jgi:hypothetical protein
MDSVGRIIFVHPDAFTRHKIHTEYGAPPCCQHSLCKKQAKIALSAMLHCYKYMTRQRQL